MSKASIFEFDKGHFAVTIIISKEMLVKGFLPLFEKLSRSWRGRYQKTMKDLVKAADEALNPKK